jgi:serine O-acetyltransferase
LSPSSESAAPPAQGPAESVTLDRAERPTFFREVAADARFTAAYRGERHEFRSRLDSVLQTLRLMAQTDAFAGLVAYRAGACMRAIGIPVLPWIAHRLAITLGSVSIADTVVVDPGVAIPSGQVVIEGTAEIQGFVVLLPWVTIGPLASGSAGPKIGFASRIATGAKVLGGIELGANSRVGVNAVVLDDVPPNTTVVGMPARPIPD